MKQKINGRLIFIAILVTIITTTSITVVYYELFKEQVKKDLRIEAELLVNAGITELVNNDSILNNGDIRITWIDKDGDVIFDNDAAAGELSNHLDRPEVVEAFKTGTGESVRKSDTMNLKNFYYAVLMHDGTVIRVSTQARSLTSVFVSTFPVILSIILMITVLCVIVSRLLTRQLLRPIEEMAENMDDVSFVAKYDELDPFMERIREQHENILSAAKSRQDFTANVSHELKTPLTAISGYAELIENRMVDENKSVYFANEIRKNADLLVSLINDIIRLSEIDQTTMPDFELIDLYEVVQGRMGILTSNAREKNVAITLSGTSCPVLSDRGMLIELIDNLVQNAIRYNVQDGKVDISVTQNENHAIFKVSDTGIGIPKEDQERIFERFYRVDKSRSRDTGGTGLGLAIVKHIVELHDGEIILNSEPGKGTEIQVLL